MFIRVAPPPEHQVGGAGSRGQIVLNEITTEDRGIEKRHGSFGGQTMGGHDSTFGYDRDGP